MTKQQMKRLIEKARQHGQEKHMKIKTLEYQIKFGECSMSMSFSVN